MHEDVLSVSQLTRQIKALLEDRFIDIWVSGEVVGCKAHSSGHLYFTLKDDAARINGVVFRNQVRSLEIPHAEFRDGAQVVCHGRLDVYPPHGAYKLLVDQVRLEGLGSLLQRIEELKRKLADEGLFDPGRKRPLPFLPRVVGIVTSPTSAAIQDMLRILGERFPCHIRLYPAQVQGQTAVDDIVAGIHTLDADPDVDVIIVGRGGGAFEDLLPFSDERVVRTLAACLKPTVSAVGHEVDFPLSDLAADVRAPTPTAAAQLVVPDRQELLRLLAGSRETLDRLGRRLLDQHAIRLADLADLLGSACDQDLLERTSRAASLATSLAASHPAQHLQAVSQRAALARAGLDSAMDALLATASQRLARNAALLGDLGPQQHLARGYALVRTPAGRVVTSPADVAAGDPLTITVREGTLHATVTE